MPRHKPPLSLKHFALATVSKSIGQATVSLQRKWSSFEKEECQLEAKTIGEKLFGELSATMVNEVCNFVINDYLESRAMENMWSEPGYELGGEVPEKNEGSQDQEDFQEDGSVQDSQEEEMLEESESQENSQEDQSQDGSQDQEDPQPDELPETEESQPECEDEEESEQSSQNADEKQSEEEQLRRLNDYCRICLRILFASGNATSIRLNSYLWSDPPYGEALAVEIERIGKALISFEVCQETALLESHWVRPLGYEPTRISHVIIKHLCKHCPNIRDLAVYIPTFNKVGNELSKLPNLTNLDLKVDFYDQNQNVLLSQLNDLMKNGTSLKSVRLNIWSSYGCVLKTWAKLDAPITAKFFYETDVHASEIGIVANILPNLQELNLQWTPSPKQHHKHDFSVKKAISNDIKVLSSLMLRRFTIRHFTEINQPLLDFLQTQSETLTSLHLERMKSTTVEAILSLSAVCPYLEELDFEFKAIGNKEHNSFISKYLKQLSNTTGNRWSTRKVYGNLQTLGIGSSKDCLEKFVPKLLKALDHTAKCLKIRDPNYIMIGQIEEKPTIDNLLLKEIVGNKEVEVVMVGLKIKATTIERLVKECPALRQLYHLNWDDEDRESDQEEDPEDDDTLCDEIKEDIKENNYDIVLEDFYLY